jgi:hypothetical protein
MRFSIVRAISCGLFFHCTTFESEAGLMERRTELVKYGMETNHFDSFDL